MAFVWPGGCVSGLGGAAEKMRNEPIFEARVKKTHWLPLEKRSHGTSGSGGGKAREGFAERSQDDEALPRTPRSIVAVKRAIFESGAEGKRPAGGNEAGLEMEKTAKLPGCFGRRS
jgi:hypothetical protein